MKITDEEIVLWLRGEYTQEKGLKAMMSVYQSRLYWHIRRFVNDEDTAKDVLQETFIKVYRNFSQFKEGSQLYTWLYKIAYNEALQFLKKNTKLQKVEAAAEEYLDNQMASDEVKTAEEIQKLLQKAINILPEKQRLVFTMRYYDDLPYEEIAKILEMSVGTLKTNYHYAKEKIERYILEHSEEF